MTKAYLNNIEYYLPERILSNAGIAALHPEWSIEKIAGKTGIHQRHIAAEDEYSSDMAVKAAERLFSLQGVAKGSIDYLLFCTQSPDYFLPATACILQLRLGLNKNIGATDYNMGCSGFVYGLGLAKGLIATGQAQNVLLITAETYSKFIHKNDKKNKTLFGDAAAAALVSSQKSNPTNAGDILNFSYYTDGSGANNLVVKNGGMRNRYASGIDTYIDGEFDANDDYLYMDGSAVFNFTALNVPQQVKQTLACNNLGIEDIDLFIFHQANKFMLDTLKKRSAIPDEKFYIFLENCGNTVSSTIPIAISNAIREQRIKPGYKVLLSGFGVGLSMASVVLQF